MKAKTQYGCNQCGAVFAKWSGQCSECGQWNCIEQIEISATERKTTTSATCVKLSDESHAPDRLKSGITEFDRVCGGGLVAGSVNLIGGEPGIGKSTLLLQICNAFDRQNQKCLYISGEESLNQIQLRAKRLGIEKSDIDLCNTNSCGESLQLMKSKRPNIIVVDSIQTLIVDHIDAIAGSLTQVRTCIMELTRHAKKNGCTIIVVGHVTKEGHLAGPKVMEHMVDAVFNFEGDRTQDFRLMRSVKNRFGACHEIGVFEMTGQGLCEINNPSQLFVQNRQKSVSGSTIFVGMEGTRPILMEIQALVVPSFLPSPRRTCVGCDPHRLSMIQAILQSKCDINLGSFDIYLNVVGGLKITDPAADLAMAVALISAWMDKPLRQDSIIFGEMGLSGEIRPVSGAEKRISEAEKLGYQHVFCPKTDRKLDDNSSINRHFITTSIEMVDFFK